MLAITRSEYEYGLTLGQLGRRLHKCDEYLITGPTVKSVRQQARDVKLFGFKKRGGIQFSNETQEFFQWWDRKEIK